MPYDVVECPLELFLSNHEKESPYGCQPGGHCESASLKGLALVETEIGAPVSALWPWQGGGGPLHSSTEESGAGYLCPSAARRGPETLAPALRLTVILCLSSLRICAEPPARLRRAVGRPVSRQGAFWSARWRYLNLRTNDRNHCQSRRGIVTFQSEETIVSECPFFLSADVAKTRPVGIGTWLNDGIILWLNFVKD